MTYNDKVVRQFVIATILWGIVGMLVGVIIAAQLWLPILNLDIPWLTYGRLRPLHTNAVIFADGQVRLESNREETFESFLDGQQWCTHRLAVLRISNGETTRRLIICSMQQKGADDFRRLNMWLRQGLCDNTRTKQVLVLPR